MTERASPLVDKADAEILRRAAAVIRRRSDNPKRFFVSVFIGILERKAAEIEGRHLGAG